MRTVEVKVGNIRIGGDNPVRVQSMTNTDTSDVESTVKQVVELFDAGSELVRFTVKDESNAAAVAKIRDKLREIGCKVPLIGDFHYNGHLLLTKYPDCAEALDKYRINPGNVGKRDANFNMIIDKAIEHNKPVRIGVNFGSLDQQVLTRLMDENTKADVQKSADNLAVEAMVISAVESAKKAEDYGLGKDKIILSTKVSKVPLLIESYMKLAELDYALHLGLTEAGVGHKGIVASTAGLSVLLQQGIGDTIRVSLTPEPGAPRTTEVIVCQQILQSNGIRNFSPSVTSCPGCGRTTSSVFQKIAVEITKFLQYRMVDWKGKYDGVETLNVAVMGCIVNGPGESKDANLGLSLPGTGEDPVGVVYQDGKMTTKLQGNIVEDFKKIIENYVVKKYG